MNRKQLDFLVRLAYIGAIIALIWLSLRYFFLWLLPFLLAMGIASLMEPLIDGAQRRLHFKRSFTAAALTLVLLGGLIALVARAFGHKDSPSHIVQNDADSVR